MEPINFSHFHLLALRNCDEDFYLADKDIKRKMPYEPSLCLRGLLNHESLCKK